MQHLAATVAMGRERQFTRRGTSHNRSSAQGHPQILLFSSHPSVPPLPATTSEGAHSAIVNVANDITPLAAVEEEQLQRPYLPMQVYSDSHLVGSASMTAQALDGRSSSFPNRKIAGQPSMQYHERCKESFAKDTRGFRERLSTRNSAVTDLDQEAQQEESAGIAGVTRMMEHVDTNGRNRGGIISISDYMEGRLVLAPAIQPIDDKCPNMCSGNNSGVNLFTTSPGSSQVAPQPLNDESSSGTDLPLRRHLLLNSTCMSYPCLQWGSCTLAPNARGLIESNEQLIMEVILDARGGVFYGYLETIN